MPSLFDQDGDAADLLRATFGAKCGQVLQLVRETPTAAGAARE